MAGRTSAATVTLAVMLSAVGVPTISKCTPGKGTSSVGAGSHIAPGAIVLGGCTIGAACMIGAGAIVLPGAKVPDGTLVASGARYPK